MVGDAVVPNLSKICNIGTKFRQSTINLSEIYDLLGSTNFFVPIVIKFRDMGTICPHTEQLDKNWDNHII